MPGSWYCHTQAPDPAQKQAGALSCDHCGEAAMAQATATLIYELPTGGQLTACLDRDDAYPDALSDLATRCVDMMADVLERVQAMSGENRDDEA